jgi:SAM-dependent methyltransferase
MLPFLRKQLDYRAYWDARYRSGGDSGSGSAGELAAFKAEVINATLARYACSSVIEFGCGDGRNLQLYDIPLYTGLDVSPAALRRCAEMFTDDASKSFLPYDPRSFVNHGALTADAALSIDVLYHIVDDDDYRKSLADLFGAARKLVILYTSLDAWQREPYVKGSHVRHRDTRSDLAAFPWHVVETIPNRHPELSSASFVILQPAE